MSKMSWIIFLCFSSNFERISSLILVNKKLDPIDIVSKGYFGSDVSVWKDIAVIGALGRYSEGNIKTGAAYVYMCNETGDWLYQTKLIPFDGRNDDYFGNAVSNQENMIAIGSMYHDLTSASNAGDLFSIFSMNISQVRSMCMSLTLGAGVNKRNWLPLMQQRMITLEYH